jgi:hypothetical protein
MESLQTYFDRAEHAESAAAELEPEPENDRIENYWLHVAQIEATLAVAAAVAELTERLGAQIVHELRS